MKLSRYTGMLLLGISSLSWAGSPAGLWKTTDDTTGKVRAIVQISESKGVLSATIVRTFPEPGDPTICQKCPGKLKDHPFVGLQFAWNLKEQGNDEWAQGEILDPQSGKIYHAKLALKGDKLYVRGFIGVSLIGRTQVWTRA
jgi:uncharacterized protein (DUF2147 family)